MERPHGYIAASLVCSFYCCYNVVIVVAKISPRFVFN